MTNRTMSMTDRMEAAEIINRLVGDSESYDPALAVRLIELIPVVNQRPREIFTFRGSSKSGGFTGFSPGIGDIHVKDDRKTSSEFVIGAVSLHRMGHYKVNHIPGVIVIKGMWHGTGGREDEEETELIYDKHQPQDGSRTLLLTWIPVEVQLGRLYLGFGIFKRMWKAPQGVPLEKAHADTERLNKRFIYEFIGIALVLILLCVIVITVFAL